MLIAPLDSLNFSGFIWTFKLLPSKHTDIIIRHAKPFVRNEVITVTVFTEMQHDSDLRQPPETCRTR